MSIFTSLSSFTKGAAPAALALVTAAGAAQAQSISSQEAVKQSNGYFLAECFKGVMNSKLYHMVESRKGELAQFPRSEAEAMEPESYAKLVIEKLGGEFQRYIEPYSEFCPIQVLGRPLTEDEWSNYEKFLIDNFDRAVFSEEMNVFERKIGERTLLQVYGSAYPDPQAE